MKYQHSSYEVLWQNKSDSSADILANACESVLRKCAFLSRKLLPGSRRLLTFRGWVLMADTARRILRRNSLLR